MVEPVEAGEQPSVLLVALQLVDEGELPADEVLACAARRWRTSGSRCAGVTACRSTSSAAVDCTRLNAAASSPSSSPVATSMAGRVAGTCSSDLLAVGDPDQLSVGEVGHVRRRGGQAAQRVRDRAAERDRQSGQQPEQQAHRARRSMRSALARVARLVAASAIWLVTWSWTERRRLDCASTRGEDVGDVGLTTGSAGGAVRHLRGQRRRPGAPLHPGRPARPAPACSASACWTNRSMNIGACADASSSRTRPVCGSTAAAISAMLAQGAELVGAQQRIERGELPGALGVAGPLRNQPQCVDQARR